jgi:hypothetical protein
MNKPIPKPPQRHYGPHPSRELCERFKARPYQGQAPEAARIVIVGRDANYSEAISTHAFFARILEYHDDGVTFWQRHGVHHPFLLPDYPFDRRRDGVKYHATFAKLGLGSEFASKVSFVELLDIPTIGATGAGTNTDFEQLLDANHLQRLDRLLTSGQRRAIFVSPTMLRDMLRISERFGVFHALSSVAPRKPDPETPITTIGETQIYCAYHFSDGRAHAGLPAMARTIRTLTES